MKVEVEAKDPPLEPVQGREALGVPGPEKVLDQSANLGPAVQVLTEAAAAHDAAPEISPVQGGQRAHAAIQGNVLQPSQGARRVPLVLPAVPKRSAPSARTWGEITSAYWLPISLGISRKSLAASLQSARGPCQHKGTRPTLGAPASPVLAVMHGS